MSVPAEHCYQHWLAVDPNVRADAVKILRKHLDPELLSQIKEGVEKHGSHEWVGEEPFTTYDTIVTDDGEYSLPNSFHFGYGMAVRNLLRSEGLKDEMLPPWDWYYGNGTDVRNWDDCYIQALEDAADV